jgi:hypothetical protein
MSAAQETFIQPMSLQSISIQAAGFDRGTRKKRLSTAINALMAVLMKL